MVRGGSPRATSPAKMSPYIICMFAGIWTSSLALSTDATRLTSSAAASRVNVMATISSADFPSRSSCRYRRTIVVVLPDPAGAETYEFRYGMNLLPVKRCHSIFFVARIIANFRKPSQSADSLKVAVRTTFLEQWARIRMWAKSKVAVVDAWGEYGAQARWELIE